MQWQFSGIGYQIRGASRGRSPTLTIKCSTPVPLPVRHSAKKKKSFLNGNQHRSNWNKKGTTGGILLLVWSPRESNFYGIYIHTYILDLGEKRWARKNINISFLPFIKLNPLFFFLLIVHKNGIEIPIKEKRDL